MFALRGPDKRAEFAPIAEQYRRFEPPTHWPMRAFMVCLICTFPPYPLLRIAACAAALLSLLALLVMLRNVPKLECPACHYDMTISARSHCPECGMQMLEKGRCKRCFARVLTARARRPFKIRYCGNCGCHVDTVGL